MPTRKIYFIADSHLGSLSHAKSYAKLKQIDGDKYPTSFSTEAEHAVERKLCRWLDMAAVDAEAIYMMGDIFDYWFEYRYVVPRGFVRVLGKLAELSDRGIAIHFMIGNHDIWLTDYLQNECGMIVHRQPFILTTGEKQFYLAHGDGLGDRSFSFKVLRAVFHNRFCRRAFANLHPYWALKLAHTWSNHSRITGGVDDYRGEDSEDLVVFAKQYLQEHPEIDFFVFGHRHIMLDLQLSQRSRVIILGDWLQYFSYGVFDGERFKLEMFEADENISQ